MGYWHCINVLVVGTAARRTFRFFDDHVRLVSAINCVLSSDHSCACIASIKHARCIVRSR